MLKDAPERGSGHVAELRQLADGPRFSSVGMHRLKSWRKAWIRGCAEPRWSGGTAGKASPKPQHHENVQQSIEHRLLAGLDVQHLPRKERDHSVDRVINARGK
jgi:hypothetical protein